MKTVTIIGLLSLFLVALSPGNQGYMIGKNSIIEVRVIVVAPSDTMEFGTKPYPLWSKIIMKDRKTGIYNEYYKISTGKGKKWTRI
jgi:hypothetical protein